MKPLTIEYAIENKFTYRDCIRYFNPDWNDDQVEFFLFEQTNYPFVKGQAFIEGLNSHFLNIKNL